MAATTSPRTNFDAPSIAPKKSASRLNMSRRRSASFAPIDPAFTSASMAIWRPGAQRSALVRWVLMILVINAVIDVATPDISIAAHAGGFVAGVLLALLLRYGRPRVAY